MHVNESKKQIFTFTKGCVFAFSFIDNTRALVVKYNCDAWGNHKVLDGNGKVNTSDSFIGNINPFRYKGYY